MSEKTFFFDRYKPVFDIVCRLLGNSWRVNLLDDCRYRVKLSSPELRGFIITVRPEKDRLVIRGMVDSRSWRGGENRCTVSPQRDPAGIAADIARRILVNARQEVEKALAYEQGLESAQEQKQILKGMLSRLVTLESRYDSLTGFRTDNGLSGKISEYGQGYDFSVQGLNVEQLIKITGALKNL